MYKLQEQICGSVLSCRVTALECARSSVDANDFQTYQQLSFLTFSKSDEWALAITWPSVSFPIVTLTALSQTSSVFDSSIMRVQVSFRRQTIKNQRDVNFRQGLPIRRTISYCARWGYMDSAQRTLYMYGIRVGSVSDDVQLCTYFCVSCTSGLFVWSTAFVPFIIT